jgi:hypothetical protein
MIFPEASYGVGCGYFALFKKVGCGNQISPHCPSKKGVEIKVKMKKEKVRRFFQ